MSDICDATITYYTRGFADRAWACELPAGHESIHMAEAAVSPICWFTPEVWTAA